MGECSFNLVFFLSAGHKWVKTTWKWSLQINYSISYVTKFCVHYSWNVKEKNAVKCVQQCWCKEIFWVKWAFQRNIWLSMNEYRGKFRKVDDVSKSVEREEKSVYALSLLKCKRYQPQNAVYLLCVNWSHSKVIKRNRLTGTVIHISHQSMNSEGKRQSDTMKNICIQTSSTCIGSSLLVARICYKPIDKFTCRTHPARYTVIANVNTQWWKAKPRHRTKCENG